MEFVVSTKDLFDRFANEVDEVRWLSESERNDFYTEMLFFVGDTLHQHFELPERSEFYEMIKEMVYHTFGEAAYLTVIPHREICSMVEELFFRIGRYVVDMRTGKHQRITGITCYKRDTLDAIVNLEITDYRRS